MVKTARRTHRSGGFRVVPNPSFMKVLIILYRTMTNLQDLSVKGGGGGGGGYSNRRCVHIHACTAATGVKISDASAHAC